MTRKPTNLNLREVIRTIPDYPKPGIMFRDITPLFGNQLAFKQSIETLADPFRETGVDYVAGIEARGFVLGGAIAHTLSAGFVPVRKEGKLPHHRDAETYDLEYGSATIEMHRDAVGPGETVLLVDDLIATGGTAIAAVNLLRRAGAEVTEACFVIDLPDLGGAERLRAMGIQVISLVEFAGD